MIAVHKLQLQDWGGEKSKRGARIRINKEIKLTGIISTGRSIVQPLADMCSAVVVLSMPDATGWVYTEIEIYICLLR